MTFDEIGEILKQKSNQERKEMEKMRLNWFHLYNAQGAKLNSPKEVGLFQWEIDKKKVRKLTKAEIERKAKQAAKWLKIQ